MAARDRGGYRQIQTRKPQLTRSGQPAAMSGRVRPW